MLRKKECKKCGKKVSGKDQFCSNCGFKLNSNAKEDSQEWGMLGQEDDYVREMNPFENLLGNINSKVVGKMIGTAIKMIEKEIQKEVNEQKKMPQAKIRLSINGKEIELNEDSRKSEKGSCLEIPHNLSEEGIKKISKLPKEEPLTNIRRLSNKVIYEIKMPQVKSFEDISIIPLENSIEVKGVGKNKAYSKLIPLNLPIVGCNLSKGKLILELEDKN